MAVSYDKKALLAYLDRVDASRQNKALTKPDWQKFVPQQLAFQQPDVDASFDSLNSLIARNDEQTVATEQIKQQNRRAYKEYKDQQALNQSAQDNAIPDNTGSYNTGGQGGKGAPTGSPHLPTVKGANPNAPIIRQVSHGISYYINSSVASRFSNFLNALWNTGYRFSSLGGYANRNIATGPAAGKGVKSLHSYGFALDIDPGRNPVNYDKNHADDVYALPKNVGALAAKYGLSWGGNWRSYKDYMHFSVPYGGRM